MDDRADPEASHVLSYYGLVRRQRHGEINDHNLQLQEIFIRDSGARKAVRVTSSDIKLMQRLQEHHKMKKFFKELELEHQMLAEVKKQLVEAYRQIMANRS